MYSWKKPQYDFPKMREGGGVKGHLELFQKNIRFGVFIRPKPKLGVMSRSEGLLDRAHDEGLLNS